MKFLKFVAILVLLSSTSLIADGKKAPTLKKVMLGLGTDMDGLGKGIYTDDFKLIQKSAHNISNHPQPSGQVPMIAKALGKRMPLFKKSDTVVHNLAVEIEAQAKKKDMAGILKNHSKMMSGCVSCHNQFRTEVTKLLNSK